MGISRHKNSSMGVFLGKPVMIETPLVTATKVCKDYEMRTYAPALAATTVCSGDMMQGSEGFRQLARYIGAFGTPANRKEAAAQTTEGEKIAMTAPVVTAQQGGGGAEKIAMTAPVTTSQEGLSYKMAFILPSKYKSIEELPKPTDERVSLERLPSRVLAVRRFGGYARKDDVAKQTKILLDALARDDVTVCGGGQVELARYNDPFTPWFLRTNEVWTQVQNQQEDDDTVH